jgi:cell wall-associated NlpC family hydrolase
MTKAIGGLLAATLAVIFTCAAGIAMFLGAPTAGCALPAVAVSGATATISPPPGGWQPIGEWDTNQVANAATIISVGASMGVPLHGQVIAIATAIQESDLRNLPNLGPANDHDSLGLFQQRPSQGWGTLAQIMDPIYASTKFYQKLLSIPGWQTMALTDAAQAVQHSADGSLYAKHEGRATALIRSLTGLIDPSAGTIDCTGDTGALQALPSGFALPPDTLPAVVTAIAWALGQLGTPYHLDGDCTAAHSGDPAHQCDCSSLVQQAYRAAGINLPRTATEQSTVGMMVQPGQLRPGDLLFTPGSEGSVAEPGHGGMVIGGGLLVVAPHTGASVRLEHVDGWLNDLIVARREVP